MSHEDHHIDVIVVVSGQPQPVRINTNQKLEKLVREALNSTSNHGQPPGEWELRREDGSLLEQNLRVGDVGLVDGMTLFLNPRAGAGGCHH